MSPEPRSVVRAGNISATGLPRLVTTIGTLVRFISSINARHLALKAVAVTVVAFMAGIHICTDYMDILLILSSF
jgi:hypothetical protein